jgi:O-antigen ligase
MTPIPPYYIHLETVLLLPFLAMIAACQFARAGDSFQSLRSARLQTFGFFGVFFVLVAGFGIGLSTVSPLLGVELAIGFTLALLHPVNALCFFVHMLFLRPWDIVPNHPILLALPRLLAATCFISWLLHPWRHSTPGVPTYRALGLLLAFSAWLFLSTFVTPDSAFAQASWFEIYFKALIVFLMCSFFIENERSVSEFKFTILLSVFSMAVLGFQQFSSASQDRMGAVSMLDPNDLAAISVIAVPLALSLVVSPVRGASQRMIGLLFFVVCVMAIWYSQSRGALLALVVQIGAFQVLRSLSNKKWIVPIVTLALASAVYLFAVRNMQRAADDLEASSASRMTYWKTAAVMTARNPLMGVGFGQFPEKYESYSTSLKYEWGKRTAHSSWLLAFAESGVLGGLLFVGFFISILLTAWRNRKESPENFYAIGGYGVAMSFLSHTYLLFPYMLYGLILATDSIKRKSSATA